MLGAASGDAMSIVRAWWLVPNHVARCCLGGCHKYHARAAGSCPLTVRALQSALPLCGAPRKKLQALQRPQPWVW